MEALMKNKVGCTLPVIDSVTLSLTSTCNISCTYCQNYTYFNTLGRKVVMPEKVLSRIISSYLSFAMLNQQQRIQFVFSGGEPLSVGLEYFNKVIQIQNKFLKNNEIQVINSIQTNGTLLDQNWISYIKDNNFHICISLDGPKFIHDKQRVDFTGKGTLYRVIEGIQLLQANDVPFNFLVVITKNSINHEEEIYRFLYTLKPTGIGFLPCMNRGPVISPKEYAEFMIRMFDLWFEDGNYQIPIREFKYLLLTMLGMKNEPRLCDYCGDCPRTINICPDGTINVCDFYMGAKEGILGNILDLDFVELVHSHKFQEFKRLTKNVPKSCRGCEYFEYCRGGCPYRRNNFTQVDYFCPARKQIIQYVGTTLENSINRMVEASPKLKHALNENEIPNLR